MILVGNQRGGARDLAAHLMKEDNERVEIHDLRGFVAQDLDGAFTESYAISRATKCKQYLYSLSLNPPKGESVSKQEFEQAIERVEVKLNLKGQPRAIVFHEKQGLDGDVRRHAHAVWSRIDTEEMKAVHLPFDREKLQEVSRELYREHGWKMPAGLADRTKSDPRNFTLEEWQQARRIGKDPRDIKDAMQDAWSMSDSKAAFEQALEERGYKLARGERRGYVAVDTEGEVYSVPKQIGKKTKEVRARLGDPEELQSVSEAQSAFAADMTASMQRIQSEADTREEAEKERQKREREDLEERQRREKQEERERLEARQRQEEEEREARFRKGIAGLWDRVRGEHARVTHQNEMEQRLATLRDQAEQRQAQIEQQRERVKLAHEFTAEQQRQDQLKADIQTDLDRYRQMREQSDQERLQALRDRQSQIQPTQEQPNNRDPTLER